MISRKKISRTGLILFISVVLLGVSIAFLPWRAWVETRLEKFLEAQGLQNVELSVAHFGLRGIVLEDIKFGTTTPLTLKNLTLDYSLQALLGGQLNDLVLTGLDLEIRNDNEEWTVSGLESRASSGDTPLSLPLSGKKLAGIPMNSARLEDSFLHILADGWRMDIPLNLGWQSQPTPELSYKADDLAWKAGDLSLTTGEATAKATLASGREEWTGPWEIQDIHVSGIDDVPALHGKGRVLLSPEHIKAEGQFDGADKTYTAHFQMDYALNDKKKSRLLLTDAGMPWKSGRISTEKVTIPLGIKQPIKFTLNIEHVSLDALMHQLTGGRSSATGTISGALPVTFMPDGTLVIETGMLKADNAGTISMPPDVIPGDNQQVALMRDVLKNFQYNLLSATVDNDRNNRLVLLMKLEGKNPDVYEGRPVKLNVRLTGNVLDFIQQNVISITDPTKLLERGQDAQ